MIPEISLLDEHLHGERWNKETQTQFYNLLRENDFFEGKSSSMPDFSARDRINRSPKILGFVSLPIIGLTPAGKDFVNKKDKGEVLLRQLLKFQLPSPYHPLSEDSAKFCVKPYLEFLRLIYTLGELKFDELQIFGMKIVDYHNFDSIVEKIKKFRREKEKYKGKYKKFKDRIFTAEVRDSYKSLLSKGKVKTRESDDKSVQNFIKTKMNNLRDYSDAAVRYLRATGLINVTAVGKTLSIVDERKKDVEYILKTVEREPCFVDDVKKFEDYLWSNSLPKLLTDDKAKILDKLNKEFNIVEKANKPLDKLKEILNKEIDGRRNKKIKEQISELKSYALYNDIETKFNEMRNTYDPPLYFEWNTWRAMAMLDDGVIKGNFKPDDSGAPMSTAPGKEPDIECEYKDFDLIVEVSLSTGALQFKMEGEPVPRHIGAKKDKSNKETFCFFIAPVINDATVAHFYTLYFTNVKHYGGRCCIIPMTLTVFRKMLKNAYEAKRKPCSQDIKKIFEKSKKYAKECMVKDLTETDWYSKVSNDLNNWLSV